MARLRHRRAEDRSVLADPLPAVARGAGRAAAGDGRPPVLDAALRAQARRRGVPQRLVAHVRGRRSRGALVGHVLPRGGRRGVRRGAGRRRRRAVQAAPAGGGVPPRRPAARRGVGAARGRRRAGPGARRLDAGRQRLHRAGVDAAAARAAPAAADHRRAHGRPRGGAVPAAGRGGTSGCGWTRRWSSPTSGCPTPTGWCRGWSTCSPRSCSAPTSRPSPTPTRTSSRGWPASTSATTGCARCAGRTARSCSGSLDDGLPGRAQLQ